MIAISELRIGNLVTFSDGDIFTIIELSHTENLCVVDKFDQWHACSGGVEPIPITDEWLLKFGGERDSDGCAFIYENKEADLRLYANEGWIQECKGAYGSLSWYKHINSVHLLQNLYFALTGKELQYNGNV